MMNYKTTNKKQETANFISTTENIAQHNVPNTCDYSVLKLLTGFILAALIDW